MASCSKAGRVRSRRTADCWSSPGLRVPAYPGATGPGMVVSILAGVNADGTSDMTLAGQWFPVAQQVSLSGNTIELLMENPLPAPPPGGYYVVEVTGGFVNNTIQGNTLDLTGKSSTGIKLDGEDYGTRIIGNHIIGGTIYNDGYTGTAIQLGAAIDSAGSGSGAFPVPWGWTALPNLGAVIEEQCDPGLPRRHPHRCGAWRQLLGRAGRQHLGDRARLPDGDRDREHIRV